MNQNNNKRELLFIVTPYNFKHLDIFELSDRNKWYLSGRNNDKPVEDNFIDRLNSIANQIITPEGFNHPISIVKVEDLTEEEKVKYDVISTDNNNSNQIIILWLQKKEVKEKLLNN